jgi:integrase
MDEKHTILDGRVHIYRRERSSLWQCSTYLEGRNWRTSTKEDNLSRAKDFAEDWYFQLRSKKASGELKKRGKTFNDAADQFLLEYPVITEGQRHPNYVDSKEQHLRLHLRPFFGDKVLSEITSGMVTEYRMKRLQSKTNRDKPPSRSSLHQEVVTLRQVLKTAHSQGWLTHLPILSSPYKGSMKISHRAWFSPVEYKTLVEATRQRAEQPLHNRHREACKQLHDFVLFMANTGLRPDEARRLQFRDVTVVKDAGTKETILEIEVRGKRGVGWCKSTPNAVFPFKRLKERVKPQPTDVVFPGNHRGLFNTILDELGMKTDRDGHERTAYSLRHTYICFRLMEGADIYQIAKNCRTSVEMIEKYYASHIKNMLDASAINVRKGRRRGSTVVEEFAEAAE